MNQENRKNRNINLAKNLRTNLSRRKESDAKTNDDAATNNDDVGIANEVDNESYEPNNNDQSFVNKKRPAFSKHKHMNKKPLSKNFFIRFFQRINILFCNLIGKKHNYYINFDKSNRNFNKYKKHNKKFHAKTHK